MMSLQPPRPASSQQADLPLIFAGHESLKWAEFMSATESVRKVLQNSNLHFNELASQNYTCTVHAPGVMSFSLNSQFLNENLWPHVLKPRIKGK